MQLMYPWFLLGLVSVTIPVVIHLLQLRRPQRLLFTNTAFIREVELVTVRHRNLQHWLILLARILGIAALVLAFCQPFIPAYRHANAEAMAVLVDNSFSMQRPTVSQKFLFEVAKEEARKMGLRAPASSRFALMGNGNGLLSQAAYQSKLDELLLTAHNPFAALRRNINGSNRKDKSFYVFSDFQKQGFNATDLDGFGGREVMLVPLAGEVVSNVYVDSVWLDDAFVRVRTNAGLHVKIKNGGEVVARDCPVKVYLGARQVAAFRVTVEPGQAVASVVQVQVADEALALGRVVTEDAPVTFDNTYYFTLQPAAAIRVLEIGAEPMTQQLYRNEPLFSYAFAKPQNVDYGVLRRSNMVLIRELAGIDAGLREGLRGVVKRGGTVVVVPSAEATGHDSYQQLFKALGVGAAQWEAKTDAPEMREIAMPGAREPFFRDVFGAAQRGVTMPRVAPVLRWARTGTDVLRLRDGESYLANFARGAGQVYVFSAPFAKAYSDFVSHALFVPVMYRLAMLSYQSVQLPAYRLTQGVGLKLPAADEAAGPTDEAGFRLVRDSVTLIPAQRVMGTDLRLEMPVGMNQPGFYRVEQRGKVLTTLAFNQDKHESELASYSAEELRRLVGPNRPNIRVVENGLAGEGLAGLGAGQTGQPLWRYCVALALACLLAEALLVRFGSSRTGRMKRPVAA